MIDLTWLNYWFWLRPLKYTKSITTHISSYLKNKHIKVHGFYTIYESNCNYYWYNVNPQYKNSISLFNMIYISLHVLKMKWTNFCMFLFCIFHNLSLFAGIPSMNEHLTEQISLRKKTKTTVKNVQKSNKKNSMRKNLESLFLFLNCEQLIKNKYIYNTLFSSVDIRNSINT